MQISMFGRRERVGGGTGIGVAFEFFLIKFLTLGNVPFYLCSKPLSSLFKHRYLHYWQCIATYLPSAVRYPVTVMPNPSEESSLFNSIIVISASLKPPQ